MKYIICSSSYALFQKIVEEIKKVHNIEETNVSYYSFLEKNSLSKALTNFLATSIFQEIKLIILKDSDFLNDKSLLPKDKKFLNNFLSLNSENIIIFYVEKLKTTNSFYSEIKDKVRLISKSPPRGKEVNEFIINYFKNHKISFDREVIYEIVKRNHNNFDLLVSQLEKTKILDEKITSKNIDEIFFDSKGESIFTLLNSVFNKNFNNIEKSLKKLKLQGIDSIPVLKFLINELVLVIQIKLHFQLGNFSEFSSNLSTLSNEMNLNPYRLKKIYEKSLIWKIDELVTLLESLIKLEMDIKINNPEKVEKIIEASLFLHN